jgi:hypothetical protein
MTIDDLVTRQKSAAMWNSFGAQLEARIRAAIPTIEQRVMELCELELQVDRSAPGGMAREDRFDLSSGQLLKFSVAHLYTSVKLSTLGCTYTRESSGPWTIRVWDSQPDGTYELTCTRSVPAVPLAIAADSPTAHLMWWSDSGDDDRVANAIVSVLGGTQVTSEFKLRPYKRPEPMSRGNSFCLALFLGIAALAFTFTLWYYISGG